MDFANNNTEHVVTVTTATNSVSLHGQWKQNHTLSHTYLRAELSLHLSLWCISVRCSTRKSWTFDASLSVRTLRCIVKGKTYCELLTTFEKKKTPKPPTTIWRLCRAKQILCEYFISMNANELMFWINRMRFCRNRIYRCDLERVRKIVCRLMRDRVVFSSTFRIQVHSNVLLLVLIPFAAFQEKQYN